VRRKYRSVWQGTNQSCAFQPGPFLLATESDYDWYDALGNYDDRETEQEARARQRKDLEDIMSEHRILSGEQLADEVLDWWDQVNDGQPVPEMVIRAYEVHARTRGRRFDWNNQDTWIDNRDYDRSKQEGKI
jgi:hypothetical protein